LFYAIVAFLKEWASIKKAINKKHYSQTRAKRFYKTGKKEALVYSFSKKSIISLSVPW
jgi:hypothetical protein